MRYLKLLVTCSCFGVLMLLHSCALDQDYDGTKITVTQNEQSLNLTTANGGKLAASIGKLKEQLAVRIADRYGRDVDFTITGIEHFSLPNNRYVAIINYKTDDGRTNKVIRSNASLTYDNKSMSVTKTRAEPPGGGLELEYECIGTCPDKDCFPIFNTTTKDVYCSCSSTGSHTCVLYTYKS